MLEDGSRLQVRLLPTGDQRLTFRAVGIEEVLTIDSNGVSELLGNATRLEDTQWAGQSDETTMTAFLRASQLKGRFVEEMLDERSIPIAWQPTLSLWASPLSPLATGAIRSASWLQPSGKADRQVSEKQAAEVAERGSEFRSSVSIRQFSWFGPWPPCASWARLPRQTSRRQNQPPPPTRWPVLAVTFICVPVSRCGPRFIESMNVASTSSPIRLPRLLP